MDFKELIIIICVGYFGLLCEGRRNPYDGENLSSMYDVGDLKVHQNSPHKWEITWKFKNFFSLPQYRQLTQYFGSKNFHFHVYLSPKGIYENEGFSPFWLAYRFKSSNPAEEDLFPNVTCDFYVKTSEGKLYKALGDRGRIAKYGGHCNSLIPRTEIVGRNGTLVPGGVLTLVVKLQWRTKKGKSIQTTDHVESESNESGWFETLNEISEIINEELPERFGILKIAEESLTSVEVTWKIQDFFFLPYRQDVGILSPNFKSDDFHGYFAMDPKGSVNIPEFIGFRSIVFRGNNRREKIYLQLYLKERDGTLREFAAKEEYQNYFAAYVPKSEINDRIEEMVPEGVLTLVLKFSTTKEDVDSREPAYLPSSTDLPYPTDDPSLTSKLSRNSTSKIEEKRKNGDCDCESMESSMQKFSSDVLSLYKSGEYSDVSLECGDRKVPAHKSILSARSRVFADMFRREVDRKAGTVDVSEVPLPTLDLMLQYLYSGVLEIPRDQLEMTSLCKAADKYGIESLKSKCLAYLFSLITNTSHP